MNSGSTAPNVLVLQVGARRGYVVPRMLEEAGALHSLHTTMALPDNDPSSLTRLARHLLPSRAATLDRRVVRGIPKTKLHTAWSAEAIRMIVAQLNNSNVSARFATSRALSWKTRLRSTLGANVVLSVDGSGGSALLLKLKKSGLPIVVDIAITPLALEIVHAAGIDWPEWPTPRPTEKDKRLFRRWYEEIVGLADLVLYPSTCVLEGLQSLQAFDSAKSRHVPYAFGAIEPVPPRPVSGRILFAGSDVLRKGLPYFAEAFHILRARGFNYEFVVAGAVPDSIRMLPYVAGLTFLGHVSRQRMAKEMARADLFCLPSLAEGTAAVTLEALASGLPCVVTSAAGAPITDGVEGIVVPEHDSTAIANAINAIVGDRECRARMADEALFLSSTLGPAHVRERLVAVLSEIAGSTPS